MLNTLRQFEIRRFVFQYAVTSGLRAAYNRWQHRFVERTLNQSLRLPSGDFDADTSEGPAKFTFWHKKPNTSAVCSRNNNEPAWHWGFLTARLVSPPVSPADYQRVCRTSHFGDAHFEAAFRYRLDECRVFAIKNTARDYCGWVNRPSLSERLSLGSRRAEAVELYQVFAAELRQHFPSVLLEPPSVCVELAVQPGLLAGNVPHRLEKFKQQYKQLHFDLLRIEQSQKQQQQRLCALYLHK
jgi:hypothetical protein